MTHLIMPQTLSGKRHQNSGYNFKETGHRTTITMDVDSGMSHILWLICQVFLQKILFLLKNDRSVYRFEYLTSWEIDSSF